MAEDGFTLPTDAFVEILLRLPTSARRRFRLVCKRWRDVINERTPERQTRSQILAFISCSSRSRALVFDKVGRPQYTWTYYSSSYYTAYVYMVGTCNGLICLLDADCPAGADVDSRTTAPMSTITVANPITGETKALPPVPTAWDPNRSRGLYAFGYHPTTGQYKVVHVHKPRALASAVARRPATVHTFTLGDSAWREVADPSLSWSYDPSCGIVAVDGSTYWITSSADRLMALDLEDERLTSFEAPPTARHA
ncbi:hypothetical protein EJB05_48533, partial [Eragrostis curvula]